MSPLLHVTTQACLARIRAEGLIPQIGERSTLMGETRAAIYFFREPEAAYQALATWLGEHFGEDEDLVILQVAVPESVPTVDEAFERRAYDTIPPECILGTLSEEELEGMVPCAWPTPQPRRQP